MSKKYTKEEIKELEKILKELESKQTFSSLQKKEKKPPRRRGEDWPTYRGRKVY